MTRVLADDARDAADRTTALLPPAPTTREATGLSADLFVQLVLKLLHFSGELSGIEIARRLGIEFSVIEPTLEFIKRLHQCEIVGGAGIGGPSFRYRITRQRAPAGQCSSSRAVSMSASRRSRWPSTSRISRRIATPSRARLHALACAKRSRISC
jgi:hypothetical protein